MSASKERYSKVIFDKPKKMLKVLRIKKSSTAVSKAPRLSIRKMFLDFTVKCKTFFLFIHF
ncbi:hypothetical protein APR43_22330 [Flavobacterium sp. NLM]|nr:hypothetical protein AKO67_01300 [Flavobacterium sp. VMW]OWU88560.1 hypothetical protein APR43_22330 [Flavobacterium sp. NLM]